MGKFQLRASNRFSRQSRSTLRTSGCNLVPTGVCGVLGDATPVRNLLSRGPGYDEGGVRNRETDSVGWSRWNTGRVSSKETTCRSRGRQEGRAQSVGG